MHSLLCIVYGYLFFVLFVLFLSLVYFWSIDWWYIAAHLHGQQQIIQLKIAKEIQNAHCGLAASCQGNQLEYENTSNKNPMIPSAISNNVSNTIPTVSATNWQELNELMCDERKQNVNRKKNTASHQNAKNETKLFRLLLCTAWNWAENKWTHLLFVFDTFWTRPLDTVDGKLTHDRV